MVQIERLKKPIVYFVILVLGAIAIDWTLAKSMFFDSQGKLKKYGLKDDMETPIPLMAVIVAAAVLATVVANK